MSKPNYLLMTQRLPGNQDDDRDISIWETDIEKANARIAELEAQILKLQGAMEYLEKSKIPWLESRIAKCTG